MAKKDEKNIKNKKSYYKEFKAELKKVVWPTPKQLLNNTSAVLAIVIVSAIIVAILNFAFDSLNKYGIDKLKSQISNSTSNTIESEENNSNVDDNSIEESNSASVDNSVEENAQ